MRLGGHRYTIHWGHLLVVTLVAATCVVYLLDARAASLSINNLLFVQPAAILALLLYVLVVPQCFHRVEATAQVEEVRVRSRLGDLAKVAGLAAALGLLVLSLETVGADTATLLFMLVGLWLCGERRPVWLVLYPLVFTLAVVWGYRQLVPYPIYTLVL